MGLDQSGNKVFTNGKGWCAEIEKGKLAGNILSHRGK